MGTQKAQNARSYMVYKNLGCGRGLVSHCIAYGCQIDTVEVSGSNPLVPITTLRTPCDLMSTD